MKTQRIQHLVEQHGAIPAEVYPGPGRNAFDYIVKFRQAAQALGWPQADIDIVVTYAMSSDYANLLTTFLEYTTGKMNGHHS